MPTKHKMVALIALLFAANQFIKSQTCPGNLLQNSNFSSGTTNWQTFSGFIPNTVPNNINCLDTFAVLRAGNTPPKYSDGMEQQVQIDSGKCYNICACIGTSFPSYNDVQFWALKNNPTLTFDSLINNTYPAGDAALIGIITLNSNSPTQQYCINGWFAPDSFSRFVVFNSSDSATASINIDNICLVQSPVCASCVNANLTASYTFNVTSGTTTQFTNTSNTGSGSIYAYQWNFGDTPNAPNDTSSQQNPVYTFSTPGSYFVCLKVFAKTADGVICVDSVCMDITITPPTPNCDTTGNGFTYTLSGDTAFFNGQSGGTPIAWEWNFGDPASGANNTSNLQNPTHIFSGPGVYYVCLYITYPGSTGTICRDTICKEITILTVGSFEHEWELSFYPNPASQLLIVSSQNLSAIEIFSLDGRLLLTKTTSSTVQVDVSGFFEGMYLLKAFSSSGIISVKKFSVYR
jgi:PKD repeat protein